MRADHVGCPFGALIAAMVMCAQVLTRPLDVQRRRASHDPQVVGNHPWYAEYLFTHTPRRCGAARCIVTMTGDAASSEVLLFGDSDVSPRTRHPGHAALAYMGMEPFHPTNVHPPDWTTILSYRTQRSAARAGTRSDVHLTYVTEEHDFFQDAALQPAGPFAQRLEAVWISSRCVAARDDLVRALMAAGLDVYSFGRCLHQPRTDTMFPECRRLGGWQEKVCIYRHFKFVVAIENTIVEDYVTEKLFDALQAAAVPLYKGAPNYHDYVPPGSTVVMDEFPTVEAVVRFVRSMGEPAHNQYFAWKRARAYPQLEYLQAHSWQNAGCALCERHLNATRSRAG